MLLLALLFPEPDVRAKPRKIIDALSEAGILISTHYLVSSALAGFDKRALAVWEIALRLVLAVLILMKPEAIWIGAVAAAGVALFWHTRMAPAEGAA